jgi:hypothetical protein
MLGKSIASGEGFEGETLTELAGVKCELEKAKSRLEKMIMAAELACKGWGLSRRFRRCPASTTMAVSAQSLPARDR